MCYIIFTPAYKVQGFSIIIKSSVRLAPSRKMSVKTAQ